MLSSFFSRLKSAAQGPGEGWGRDISTPAGRRRAMWHFYMTDHGILRRYWTNLSEIAPGVWRSNQPSSRRIKTYKDMGIHTVFCLRGARDKSPYLFEKEACDAHGLELIVLSLSARALVSRKKMLKLLDRFETIQRPFVMHCKSGADRAGLASALYLLHNEGASLEKAKEQLSFRFVHLKFTQTGILDYLLAAYESDCADDPMPIRNWLENRYDPETLTAEFNKKRAKR